LAWWEVGNLSNTQTTLDTAMIYLTWLFSPVLLCLGVLTVQVSAFSPQHSACQLQKPASASPLSGCPQGTIFVSQDDPTAHFKSVQAAVLSLCVFYFADASLPLLSRLIVYNFLVSLDEEQTLTGCSIANRPETGNAFILIGAGDYHETVNVTRTGPLTLLVSSTVLYPNDDIASRLGDGQGQLDNAHLNSTSITPTRNLVQIWDSVFVTTGLVLL
jgi:hypothetical protein